MPFARVSHELLPLGLSILSVSAMPPFLSTMMALRRQEIEGLGTYILSLLLSSTLELPLAVCITRSRSVKETLPIYCMSVTTNKSSEPLAQLNAIEIGRVVGFCSNVQPATSLEAYQKLRLKLEGSSQTTLEWELHRHITDYFFRSFVP